MPEFDPGVIQEQLKEKALSAAKNETMISGWWTPALAPISIWTISWILMTTSVMA